VLGFALMFALMLLRSDRRCNGHCRACLVTAWCRVGARPRALGKVPLSTVTDYKLAVIRCSSDGLVCRPRPE